MDVSSQTKKFFTKFSPASLTKGELLVTAGDTPKFVYYLSTGLIRQSIISPSGEVLTLHFFKPGSFLPLISTLRPHINEYNLEAYLPSIVYPAPISQVQEFLLGNPEVLMSLNGRLLDGLAGLSTRLGILTLNSARDRVLLLLSYLSKSFGETKDRSVHLTIPLAHREIATWIGTSRETASLQMENLVREGLVKYVGRQLYVTDITKLNAQLSQS